MKPNTYRPDQPRNEMVIKHYDVVLVEHALVRSGIADEIEKYAAIFGHVLQDHAPEKSPLKTNLDREVALTIDASLAGKRPDLDADIWKAIVSILKDESLTDYWHNVRNPVIHPLDIEFLNYIGINIPAAILITLFLKIGTSDEYMTISNQEGKSIAELTALNVEKSKRNLAYSSFTMRNVELNRDVSWYGFGVHVKNMPETIANSLPGRKLREFITHPVLDKFDLTVQDIAGNGDAKFLRTDHHILRGNPLNIMQMAEQCLASQ